MRRRLFVLALGSLFAAATIVGVGCKHGKTDPTTKKHKAVEPVSRYPQLPPKKVPEFMKDTVLERVDLAGTDPLRITGYGLVGRLSDTGAGPYPTAVREYMIKEMLKHGYASKLMPGYEKITPEQILADKGYAIVRVDALMLPGIRETQRFDTVVMALPESQTTSLARGQLFQTDLQLPNGTPGVNVLARSQGSLTVNPAYALDVKPEQKAAARASLRRGTVMDGGVAMLDRPLILRLRQPQRSMTRSIEARINDRFQAVMDRRKGNKEPGQADAQDEAIIHVFVPKAYESDWEHFAGVVTHLYMNGAPEYAAVKARKLADEAVKPDAPLLDISFAWEGLGETALPFIKPLMTNASPEVAFAASRAAAFLGDASAQESLIQIASQSSNPFQVNAVEVLGRLQSAPLVNRKLRELLSSNQTLVRLAAYNALVRNRDSIIFSKVIGGTVGAFNEEKFVLDIVPAGGMPLVYATRTGLPRIAVMGTRVALERPVTFSAMDNRLTISSNEVGSTITIYYRPLAPDAAPVKIVSGPDLSEVVSRLGGAAAEDEVNRLDFTYGDVVAILQALADQRKLSGQQVASKPPTTGAQTQVAARVPASFVLQDLPEVKEIFEEAPPIPEQGRPQGEPTQASDAGAGAGRPASDSDSRKNLSQ